jgi:hypothetical protein
MIGDLSYLGARLGYITLQEKTSKMTYSGEDEVTTDAIVGFSFVPAPDLPLVSQRPKKINLATVRELLAPDEKLISWGTVPKATYFAFDERFLTYLFLLVVLIGGIYDLLPHFGPLFYERLSGLHGVDWPRYLLFASLGWLGWSRIRKVSYVLTDKRLIRIPQFQQSFDLAAFDRVVRHNNNNGVTFIELWMKNGEGPTVVLELGRQPDAIMAAFTVAIEGRKETPEITAAAAPEMCSTPKSPGPES